MTRTSSNGPAGKRNAKPAGHRADRIRRSQDLEWDVRARSVLNRLLAAVETHSDVARAEMAWSKDKARSASLVDVYDMMAWVLVSVRDDPSINRAAAVQGV